MRFSSSNAALSSPATPLVTTVRVPVPNRSTRVTMPAAPRDSTMQHAALVEAHRDRLVHVVRDEFGRATVQRDPEDLARCIMCG